MESIALEPPTQAVLQVHHGSRPLLSSTELRFLSCLKRIVRDRWQVVAKARLVDFIEHFYSAPYSEELSRHRVDFLLCKRDDWTPMIGISLDDPDDPGPAQPLTNCSVKLLLATAGIPLLKAGAWEMDYPEGLLMRIDEAWDRRERILAYY